MTAFETRGSLQLIFSRAEYVLRLLRALTRSKTASFRVTSLSTIAMEPRYTRPCTKRIKKARATLIMRIHASPADIDVSAMNSRRWTASKTLLLHFTRTTRMTLRRLVSDDHHMAMTRRTPTTRPASESETSFSLGRYAISSSAVCLLPKLTGHCLGRPILITAWLGGGLRFLVACVLGMACLHSFVSRYVVPISSGRDLGGTY